MQAGASTTCGRRLLYLITCFPNISQGDTHHAFSSCCMFHAAGRDLLCPSPLHLIAGDFSAASRNTSNCLTFIIYGSNRPDN